MPYCGQLAPPKTKGWHKTVLAEYQPPLGVLPDLIPLAAGATDSSVFRFSGDVHLVYADALRQSKRVGGIPRHSGQGLEGLAVLKSSPIVPGQGQSETCLTS
jgi:hypothetical protein